MNPVILAAVLFAVLSGVVIAFQIALALGAPWGEFTLGGRHRGVLPGAWRLVPVFSAVLLAGFVVVVFARAGIGFEPWRDVAHPLVWVVVGYSAVGCIANAVTPSARERRIWLPVVALMLASSLVVALN